MSEVRSVSHGSIGTAKSDPLGNPLARAAFEAANEGLLLLSGDGLVLAMNAAFGTMYGIDPAAALGLPYLDFARHLEVRRLDQSVERESWITMRALRGEQISGVVQNIRNLQTGRDFFARCGAVPCFIDGRLAAVTITVEDVTKATRAQQSLEGALSAAEVGTYREDLVEDKVWGDPNFARLHGLTREETSGGPTARLYDLIHPDDRERVRRGLEKACGLGVPHEVEYRVVPPGGNVRWLLSRGRAERDDRGTAIQRLGSVVDITARREATEQLEAQSARYEAILEAEARITAVDGDYRGLLDAAMNEASRVTAGDGACLEIRDGGDMVYEAAVGVAGGFIGLRLPAAGSLSGLTLENGEPTLCDDSETDPRVDREACRRIGIRSMALVPLRYDHRSFGVLKVMARRPGALSQIDLQALELLSGFLGAAIGRARATQALRESEANLERRVAERTAQLQAANEALESFTHHVAHDLRSPLRSIVSTSHIAAEDFADVLPPAALDMLDRQAKSAKRMALLIDDLLAMARLSRTEAQRIPTNVSELAREARDEALAAHPESRVKIEVAEGMQAQADPRLLKLVLVNLVENGVKYSPEGGTVRVGRREDGAFFVSDEGIGIEPRYFEKVFEPFQRLHREERFQGTGIGLSNVKQIVTLHAGHVWVESEPGKGSTFLFTLG